MSSHYYDILASVSNTLGSLLPAVPNVIRKRPFHSTDAGDPLPFICISPTVETISEKMMNNVAFVDYPIQIVLFQARDGALQSPADLQTCLATRQTIRLGLSKTHNGDVSSVHRFTYDPSPAFDLSGLDSLYDVSCQLFTYTNTEPRSV